MATNFLRLTLSVLSIFILLSPALTYNATKTFTLDLIDESQEYHENLVRRQVEDNGWRKSDILYVSATAIQSNSTQLQFFVNVSIGDRNKNLKLAVSQSSYTWVASPWNSTQDCPPLIESFVCSNIRSSGFFSLYPPDSSSYRNLSGSFDLLFTDDSYVQAQLFAIGHWGRDKFRLGQLTIDDVNFGVGRSYNETSILGLGSSSYFTKYPITKYPTFLEVMQKNDIINTPSYGIYIGDIRGREASGKSITFGGVDVAKFALPVKTLSGGSSYSYPLNLLGIDIVSGGEVISKPLERSEGAPRSYASMLKLSAFSIHLPSDAFYLVTTNLGAWAEELGYIIDRVPPDGSGLNFTFTDGLSIFVPYSQMAAPISSTQYVLLLVPNDKDIIFGTPFFRSAYVFYDFQNDEVSIARALYNITASNITEVGANKASLSVIKWLYEDPNQRSNQTTSSRPTQRPTGGPNIAVIIGGVVAGVTVVSIIGGISIYLFKSPPSDPRIITVVPQMQEENGTDQAPRPASDHNEYINGQLSTTRPIDPSSVTSPVSAMSTNSWVRPGNSTALNPRANAYQI
ncbi:hypothetical protein TWF970_009220 [Orbilia oligospora]|uniref:Peptidase A1 domain-containing protein n=1 Tax=Orbilia oligospora TaxID=2813651 RepID=A0A7C8R3I7_ORBOL|nr:hypothetical protein TWF970_009220 [Orbilia oligospora]